MDAVLKFRMLVLQSLHGLSLEATERMVRDRLSWMRLGGLGIADTVPDANTLWDFREALIRADALDACSARSWAFMPHPALRQICHNAAPASEHSCDMARSGPDDGENWPDLSNATRRTNSWSSTSPTPRGEAEPVDIARP